MADYACCPYDDAGQIEGSCHLTEKTPYGDRDEGECKSWEANTDATFDGNADGEDWGCCGFQRHFVWGQDPVEHGDLTQYHTFDIDVGAGNNPPNTGFPVFDEIQGTRDNFPLGNPRLGGICKLFVPVRYEHIKYVTIAGVHFKGGGWQGKTDTYDTNMKFWETAVPIDNTQKTETTVGNNVNPAPVDAVIFDARIANVGDTASMGGTAFCFSVVNPAECMVNTNAVHNGNVAGRGPNNSILAGNQNDAAAFTWDDDNPTVQQDPASRVVSQEATNFGDLCEKNGPQETDWAGGNPNKQDNIVAVGPNFDVVVHFRTEWCMAHWGTVDMQAGGDHGHGGTDDYNVDSTASNPHAHTDVADKSFEANSNGFDTSTGGLLGASGVTLGATGAGGLNSYTGGNGGGFKWPNAGAWAGFYSFVTCSSSTSTPSTFNPIYETDPRRLLISNFNMDYRHDSTSTNVCIRGNVRQVGTMTSFCNPGAIAHNVANRCSWNWNFDQTAFANTDGFLDYSLPVSSRTSGPNNPSRPTTTDFNIHIELRGPGNLAQNAAIMGADCHSDAGTCAVTGTSMTIVLSCTAAAVPSGGNERDAMPICFMGDEVHFQVTRPHATANIDWVQGMYSGVGHTP